ncbi:Sentrin-specific protease 2 [Sciurus carolinensis]|uniref:Sentrin-specific protease 2 n=1 Tax=Sciurus carolinensis TaxID=30640 RepID=A0AA41T7S6_SCICA|nr:Sentrin-specific protease 2 [Sciurus carolinensis]
MLKLGNKSPNGISDYPKIRVTVTREQPRGVLPSFGFTLNSEGCSRTGGLAKAKAIQSPLMWKPQEQAAIEVISEEGGKGLRCPHCTVEGVQKEEGEKYQRLLERLKEGGHGNSVPPATSHHHSSQRSQMDTLKTKAWGDEQNHGVGATRFVPK